MSRALPETANALRSASLDPALREAIILRVAALQQSAYERMQHLPQAARVGLTASEISAIETDGESEALKQRGFGPVLRFVDEVVSGPAVKNATFAAAHTELGDRDIVTAILLVGHYMTVARLTGVLDVELDQAPDPFSAEH